MGYHDMTALCGLDCFNGPMYLANENEGLRKTIAKRLNMPEEKAYCDGCRSQSGAIKNLGRQEPCNVYNCIDQKGVAFCFACGDFPREHLHPYANRASEVLHNTKVFNLCLIKKMGLEA